MSTDIKDCERKLYCKNVYLSQIFSPEIGCINWKPVIFFVHAPWRRKRWYGHTALLVI